MHEFAEEYVANLKPREERYDTRLGDDFYVATFPNGVKTWVYVFQVNGYTRRQTLGIYPEMELKQALESLYSARRTRAVETELAEQGMDGTQVRATEDSPINLTAKRRVPALNMQGLSKRFFSGIVTGVALSFAAVLAAWVFLKPLTGIEAIDKNLSFELAGHPGSAAEQNEKPGPAALAAATEASAADQESTPAPTATRTAEVTPTPASEPVEQAAPPEELSDSQRALMQMQEEMAGTLAWAQLTSDIQDGEPVDQLSWVVEVDNSPRRVFYFVRVRGLSGATVTYRWKHRGKVLKEDAVQVGQGWHSPAYSGMTLTAQRLGRWQVEVYGPDGSALGSEEFEARLTKDTPQLSQR